jgi:hypothetical protein
MSKLRDFLRHNALSLFFGLIFLGALAGQAFAGWRDFNNQQFAQGLDLISLGRYLQSADFAADVSENWQSEYLQFLLYILATVWLIQKGSPESKSPGDSGLETDKEQLVGAYARPDSPAWAKAGGARTVLFSWSLSLTMGLIFVACWLVQSVSGWAAYNETRLQQLQDALGWGSYLQSADFWNRTMQNWQSEFLAVGSMAIIGVYLRQRGSPESKSVGDPHAATGGSD